jgi:hypothetical protein
MKAKKITDLKAIEPFLVNAKDNYINDIIIDKNSIHYLNKKNQTEIIYITQKLFFEIYDMFDYDYEDDDMTVNLEWDDIEIIFENIEV